MPPGGVWRLFIDQEDYPNLGSAISVGDIVTTTWGTPITATITDVVEEPGLWWKIHVAQDITAGFSGGDTVSFGSSGNSYTWRFGTDGDLAIPPGKTIRNAMTGDDLLDIKVVRQDTAPTAANGTLWFNTVEGRLYIKYNNVWVDAAPLMMPAPATEISANSITFADSTMLTSAYTNKLVNGDKEVVLNANGDLLSSNDIIATPDGRFVKDCGDDGGTTSMRWTRIPVDTSVELIRAYTGDAENPDDVERAQISVEWQTDTQTGLSITAFDRTSGTDEYKWDFKGDGDLTLPETGKIKGGEGGTNIIDLSWELSIVSGKTININPGSGGVVSDKIWSFDSGGGLTLPLSSTLSETPASTIVTITGADHAAFNQTYIRTYGDPTYTDQYLGSNNCRIFRDSGTANKWRLRDVSTDYYESNDLITWTDFIGGADPVPTGRINSKTTDITVGSKTWTFGTDGTTTLPGAVVKSTVSKDGPLVATVGTGSAATVVAEPTNNPLWQSMVEVSVTGFSCTVTFPSVGNPAISNIVDTAGNRQVGDILATILGSVVAPGGNGLAQGQDGVDDLVIKVGTMSDIVAAVAIDLTKTVNKLADGAYTLADGIDGQIMYLVRQTGSDAANIEVEVANARVNGLAYTDTNHYPFGGVGGDGDITTMIFTDGCWQSTTTAWDL